MRRWLFFLSVDGKSVFKTVHSGVDAAWNVSILLIDVLLLLLSAVSHSCKCLLLYYITFEDPVIIFHFELQKCLCPASLCFVLASVLKTCRVITTTASCVTFTKHCAVITGANTHQGCFFLQCGGCQGFLFVWIYLLTVPAAASLLAQPQTHITVSLWLPKEGVPLRIL